MMPLCEKQRKEKMLRIIRKLLILKFISLFLNITVQKYPINIGVQQFPKIGPSKLAIDKNNIQISKKITKNKFHMLLTHCLYNKQYITSPIAYANTKL